MFLISLSFLSKFANKPSFFPSLRLDVGIAVPYSTVESGGAVNSVQQIVVILLLLQWQQCGEYTGQDFTSFDLFFSPFIILTPMVWLQK